MRIDVTIVVFLILLSCSKEKKTKVQAQEGNLGKDKKERMHYNNVDSVLQSKASSIVLTLINDDDIVFLPREISKISHLEELSFVGCDNLDLDSLFKVIANSSIRILELVSDTLVVPPSITLLKGIQELTIEADLLESIPEEIGGLKKLKILIVNSEKLKGIPESLKELNSLEELHFYCPQISQIPSFICSLQHLQKIDFSMCNITSMGDIPGCLNEIDSLKEIDLSGTPIGDSDVENYVKTGKLKHLQKLQVMLPEVRIRVAVTHVRN